MGYKAVWEWEKERDINSCRGPGGIRISFSHSTLPLFPSILQAMKKQSSEPNCQQENIDHNSLSLTNTASTITSSNSSQSHPSRGSGSSQEQSLPSTTKRLRSRSSSPFPDIPIDCLLHSSRDTPSSRTMRTSRRTESPVHMSPRSSISPNRSVYRKKQTHTRHSRRTSDDYRRYNGTVNHCGRHSNDWLFGGFSLRDTVRDGVDRLRHHGKEG